jgi:hypothetical protein
MRSVSFFKFRVSKCSLSPALSLKKFVIFSCCKKYVGREIIAQGSFKFNNYNKFKISIKIILNGVLDFKQNTYIIYCWPWRAARLILQNHQFGQYKFQTCAIRVHYGPRFCGHILYIKHFTVFLVLLFSGQRPAHASNSVSWPIDLRHNCFIFKYTYICEYTYIQIRWFLLLQHLFNFRSKQQTLMALTAISSAVMPQTCNSSWLAA